MGYNEDGDFMKSTIQIVIVSLYFFIGYTFVFGFLVFNLPLVVPSDITYDVETLLEPTSEPTYAYILDQGDMALDARLAIIEAAEESIDISYYTIHGGTARDIFFGSLLEAADRGVHINLLLDDMFYYQTRDTNLPYDAFASHENITFKFYEPYNPVLPYTIQNRLHDKFIVVDERYGIIGGRNIGDRYFEMPESDWAFTHDLDVLVFGDGPHSTITAMSDYYNALFSQPYTKLHVQHETDRILEEQTRMRDVFKAYKDTVYPDDTLNTLINTAIEVDRAAFIHGPVNRMHKEPVILRTLTEIALGYDAWFVLSPYVIFSPLMLSVLPDAEAAETITFLTNSPAVSPNPFAMSGYMRYRNDLAAVATVHEYQGEHSLHGKAMIFGDEISVIGTLNMDPRSATLSTESVMVISSETFTTEFQALMDAYIDQSLVVNPDGSYQPDSTVDMVEISRTKAIQLRIIGFFTYFFDSML